MACRCNRMSYSISASTALGGRTVEGECIAREWAETSTVGHVNSAEEMRVHDVVYSMVEQRMTPACAVVRFSVAGSVHVKGVLLIADPARRTRTPVDQQRERRRF